MKDQEAPQDLYGALGVARTAPDKEIRAAYRKLAKAHHPDLNPGDPSAEARFKQVSAAWEILGDPEKRARYDRGEIDSAGAERPQRPYWRRHAEAPGAERYDAGGFEAMSDVFADLFRRQGGATPGRDLRFHMELDFLDAIYGATRRVGLPGGGTLEISIPAGVRDGETVVPPGQCAPGRGDGPPGDALVAGAVRPHPVFSREGRHRPGTADHAGRGGAGSEGGGSHRDRPGGDDRAEGRVEREGPATSGQRREAHGPAGGRPAGPAEDRDAAES